MSWRGHNIHQIFLMVKTGWWDWLVVRCPAQATVDIDVWGDEASEVMAMLCEIAILLLFWGNWWKWETYNSTPVICKEKIIYIWRWGRGISPLLLSLSLFLPPLSPHPFSSWDIKSINVHEVVYPGRKFWWCMGPAFSDCLLLCPWELWLAEKGGHLSLFHNNLFDQNKPSRFI